MKEGIISLLALGVLVALIWFGGEYLGWTTGTRVLGIIIALAVWLGIYLIQRLLAIRSSMMIERRLRAQARDQIASSRPMEREKLGDLERRLSEAINALKSSKRGKGALAELPWYVIIGPPGSGKSTALQQSGLNFPQVNQALNGIGGVGGTRNCEWWFTDDGILLDTAGRYTTQDEDREEWMGFLSMIKEARARKPINGALVAISVPEILQASETELENHVKNVRGRLDELCSKLETVFPVYLMFTKCDLLQGFSDFFEDLSKDERGQVWGYTFPYRQLSADVYQETFARECRELYTRLCTQRLAPLAVDRHEIKRQNIYAFPLQFLTAAKKLELFIAGLFRTSSFQGEAPIFRGFYFTSGTQEGTPIDQILAAMREAFGVQDDPNKALGEEKLEKRSYFINQLFTKIIFGDEDLARSAAAAERRRTRGRIAALVVTGAATLLVVVSLLVSFFNNRALVADVGEHMADVAKTKRELPEHLTARLEALEGLRGGVKQLYEIDERLAGAPYTMSWGLYQGDSLDPKARELYFGELRSLLINPCVAGLTREMKALVAPDADNSVLKKNYGYKFDQELYEGLYELLRVYKMLADRVEGNPEVLEVVLRDRNRWLLGMRGKADENPPAQVAEMAWNQFEFFKSQLGRPIDWQIDLDEELVLKVEKKLNANYWITQTYTQIRDIRMDQTGKENLESLLPPSSKKLFGSTLEISQVFTFLEWEGQLKSAIQEKASSLSQQYAEMGKPKDEDEIRDLLERQYVEDARQTWKRWIDNLEISRSDTLREATDRLAVLADPERTPLPKLFREVWPRQHVLEVESAAMKIQKEELEVAAEDEEERTWHDWALAAFADLHGKLDRFVDESTDGKRFLPLAQPDEQNQLRLNTLNPVRDAFASSWDQLFDVVLPMVPHEQRESVRRLFKQALDRTLEALIVEAQSEAEDYWSDRIHGPWTRTLSRGYPFMAGQDEVSTEDMDDMFRPDEGAIWKARDVLERLRDYKLRGSSLVTISPRSQGSLVGAEAIRDALYPKDGKSISVGFKVKLVKGPGVRNVRLVLGKESFRQDELPPGHRKPLTWDPNQEGGAQLSILVVDQDEWTHKDFPDTDWGLPRLLTLGVFEAEGSSDRVFRYSWRYDVAEEERRCEVEFEVEREASASLLRGDLFLDWDPPPSKVGP